MSNAIYFNSYKLKKGASVPDFLLAINNLFDTNIANANGHISSVLFFDGERWADYSMWETMNDLNNFIAASRAASASSTNELAQKFYSFCNFNSGSSHRFSVEKCYGFDIKHFSAPNIISFHSYKLKKGVSVPDFLLAQERINHEFAPRQKGWISSQLLYDGKTWADIVILKTKDDLDNLATSCDQSDVTKKCFSYMDFSTMKSHCFMIQKAFSNAN